MTNYLNSKTFINKKFNRVTVISDLGVINKIRTVFGKCECGVSKPFSINSLKTGNTKSCGCFNIERLSERRRKHGLLDHPLYCVWSSIKGRCYNKNDTSYKNYGGRGVTMCDDWVNDFKSFFDWAMGNGYKKGLQIDKDINAENGMGMCYSPEYCSFVTRTKNLRSIRSNVKIDYKNETHCVTEWCEKLGFNPSTIYARLNRGWSIDDVFSKLKRQSQKEWQQ